MLESVFQWTKDKTGFSKAKIWHAILYADDLILGGNEEVIILEVKKQLSSEFEMKDPTQLMPSQPRHQTRCRWKTKNQQRQSILRMLKCFGMKSCMEISTPTETNLKLEECMTKNWQRHIFENVVLFDV